MTDRNQQLGERFPGLRNLTGPIDPELVPSACQAAIAANAPEWPDLARATLAEIEQWRHVGPRRVAAIIEFAEQSSALSGQPMVAAASEVVDSLKTLAAWAVGLGNQATIEEVRSLAAVSNVPPSVRNASERLTTFDLGTLLEEGERDRFDPSAACRRLIERFEERDREILERVVSRGIRPIRTLEEIGAAYGITRERVRQLENRLRSRLDDLLSSDEFEIVRHHARQIGSRAGAAFPIEDAPDELKPRDDDDLSDELFAHLAGPYRVADGWFVHHSLPASLKEVVGGAFEATLDGYVAPVDAVVDGLEALQVRRDLAERLLDEVDAFRVVGENVVRWRHLQDKIGGVLQTAAKPMTVEQILDAIDEQGNERSVRNHLGTNSYVKRVGKHEWALAEWDGDEYRSIVEHMRERLADGPRLVRELAAELATQYGVSEVSVTMYAGMHPSFVSESGMVRLRAADEPYVPTVSLELTRHCFVVDGAWSFAITVDHDTRRGSGRGIPEAFAVHLGLAPGAKGELRAGDRTIRLGWAMYPTIGSLKWLVDEHGLVDGDRVFIRRATPSTLDFRIVRTEVLDASRGTDTLALLVGADPSGPIERWLGDALGLGGATAPDRTHLRGRLQTRGESDLADLLDTAE